MPQKPYRGLDQLMDGAITKRFNDELTRLWDNVYDMRAPATKARTITLKVTIKPNANRDAAAILYDIKSAPAAPEALQQTVFMRQRRGLHLAWQYVPKNAGGQSETRENP